MITCLVSDGNGWYQGLSFFNPNTHFTDVFAIGEIQEQHSKIADETSMW